MTDRIGAVERRTFLTAGVTAAVGTLAGCVESISEIAGGAFANEDPGPVEIETVVDGFSEPWGMAFDEDGDHLFVTELEGTLLAVDREDGEIETVDGTPDVHAEGQGGLLDVALHPEFPDEPWLYLTYAAANDDGESATHVGRGEFDPDDETLEDFEELYVVEPFVDSDAHFGSRAVFGPDDHLYVTTGDRASKEFSEDHYSQDTSNAIGATLRLESDGSIPEDNPFVDDDEFEDAIYTYGHRNVQGMTVHPETEDIWVSEHGEEDGDELNVLEAGGNYGWPIAHTGCEYGTDDPVGDDPFERDDVVDPAYYWECGSGGFPPAGATFYDGDVFDDWAGDLFVGNLAGQYLGRFTVDDGEVEEQEPLLSGEGRVRDVAVGPDDALYVLVDASDAPLLRLTPEDEDSNDENGEDDNGEDGEDSNDENGEDDNGEDGEDSNDENGTDSDDENGEDGDGEDD